MRTPNIVDLLIMALAVTRLTLLVTTDAITAPVRERIWRRYPPERSRYGYLITCNWCTSIYTATAIVSMYRITEGPTLFVSAILALSTVAGLIANRAG